MTEGLSNNASVFVRANFLFDLQRISRRHLLQLQVITYNTIYKQ